MRSTMRWLDHVYLACGVVAGLVVGAMVLLVCVDVAGRNLGVAGLPWIVEVTELALPLATLLAAPWLLHRNEHVRLDVLDRLLSRRVLRWLERAAAAVGLVVCLAFVWYALKVIADTRAIGALVMKSLVFPEWWLFVPLPLSFGLMALEFARRLLGRGAQHGAPHVLPGED
jgi:TRAP-type C4-dicarboxylate transport system permease small subunit